MLTTHRCWFIEYLPPAIETMAKTKDSHFVAVGREDGSLEVWSTTNWVMLLKCPGIQDLDIRRVHWVEADYRGPVWVGSNPLAYWTTGGGEVMRWVITTGLNGSVIEWDLKTRLPERWVDLGSAVWDSKVKDNEEIVCVCEDGSTRIVNLDEFRES